MRKKIAIFGANGYLGSQLAVYMKQKGYEIDCFDVQARSKFDVLSYQMFDVTDVSCWESLDPESYEAILFFAGLTGVAKSFDQADRYFRVNEGGVISLCQKLVPLGAAAPKIIFPSTRLVYKGSDKPLKEDDPKEPKSPYAVNKLACEQILSAYYNFYGIPYNVIRICVPYGSLIPGLEYSYGTLGFFNKCIAAGCPITLYGDGSQRRTFSHVKDICHAVEILMSSDSPCDIFNIGGADLSLREAAERFLREKGGRIIFTPWPAMELKLESGNTVFSAHKLQVVFHKKDGHVAAY